MPPKKKLELRTSPRLQTHGIHNERAREMLALVSRRRSPDIWQKPISSYKRAIIAAQKGGQGSDRIRGTEEVDMLISATAPSTLSKTERDRRYVRLRSDLAERAVDATVVFGSNLFYLTNGLSGERAALFPTPDEPITVLINSRHLADIPVSVLRDAQDWVHDLRAGNDMSPLIERTRCLAGPSLVVTESGYRELGERTVEMLVLA